MIMMMFMVMVVIMLMVVMVIMLMVVLMLMVVIVIMVVVMLMLMCRVRCFCQRLHLQIVLSLDYFQNLGARNLIPWCRNYRSLGIQCLNLLHTELQLLRCRLLASAQYNRGRIFNLIIKELAKRFHLLRCLEGIHYRNQRVQLHVVGLLQIDYRGHNIGQFTNA